MTEIDPMEKVPPHSLEYEKSVLAGMLLDPEMCEQAVDGLKGKHFYITRHKLIFEACRELFKAQKPVELITVKNLLQEKGQLDPEKITASFVAGLLDIPIPPNVEQYAETIRNKYAVRRTLELSKRLAQSCYEPDAKIETIVSKTQESILNIETEIQTVISKDPYETLETSLMDKHESDHDRDPDKPLGYSLKKFKGLEEKIDGVQPGFYVVAAETNAGKTAFLVNLLLDLLDANENLKGLYFSLDDSRNVILNRFLSVISSTGIPLNQVQRPQTADRQKKILQDGYNALFELARGRRLFIRDASEIKDVDEMEIEIRRRAINSKLVAVIDGLYNLDVGTIGDTRKENIERANKLKSLADTYNIPVICTGELRKKERGQMDRIPDIDDLMETGKFAYNANLVLLLYPDKWEDYNNAEEPILNLRYAKNKLSHYRGTDKIKFIRKTSQVGESGDLVDKAGV